jgi:aminoglycoside phosphotransferase (APT) family kinase protein
VSDPDAAVIEAWLRAHLGATAVTVARQGRWRPAWRADADTPGGTQRLMVRGERSDVPLIFPLRHEMAFQRVLQDHGIPVSPVHGWIDGLSAYVMDRIDGRPDFTESTEAQRDAAMRDYMAILARIHRLPVAPFAAAGITRAAQPSRSGDIGMQTYERTYRAGKRRPDPFLEFALAWLTRHPTDSRGRESAIVWDSGQFHQADGRILAVLDLEIAHVGDPLMDLAAFRMRDTVLHFGDFPTLYSHYEAAGGFPVDIDAVQRHHIAFTLTNQLSFHAALAAPTPDSDYMTNLHWCSETNLHAVEALAEFHGYELEPPAEPDATDSPYAVAHEHLVQTLRAVSTDDEFVRYKIRTAFRLARHLQRADEVGGQLLDADLADTAALLGHRAKTWEESEALLEDYVRRDDGRHDEALVALFYRRFMRLKTSLGPRGSAMSRHHVVQPFARSPRTS